MLQQILIFVTPRISKSFWLNCVYMKESHFAVCGARLGEGMIPVNPCNTKASGHNLDGTIQRRIYGMNRDGLLWPGLEKGRGVEIERKVRWLNSWLIEHHWSMMRLFQLYSFRFMPDQYHQKHMTHPDCIKYQSLHGVRAVLQHGKITGIKFQ